MERYWLVAASLCFLLSFGHTLYALGAGNFRPARFNVVAMILGFLCTSTFLGLRGQEIGACPITNLFEVLIFLSWSIVLIYLLVGPAYRISLMGAFTSPLVLALLLLALTVPADMPSTRISHDPWVESHAALSIVAYGAFGLGCIAGVMYLVQERQLKSRTASELLYNLPPITDLSAVNARLLFVGFLLLTLAFGVGIAAGLPVDNAKSATSIGIWAFYGIVLLMRRVGKMAPHRIATFSVGIFLLALITLPVIQALSVHP